MLQSLILVNTTNFQIRETNANKPQDEMGNDGQMPNPSAGGTATNEERSVEVYNIFKIILYIHTSFQWLT